MLSNIQHWQSFYQASATPTFPSQFALFVQSWLMGSKETIIEVGCGNGRDSIFLNGAGHDIVVTDQVVGDSLKDLANEDSSFGYVEGDVVEAIKSMQTQVNMSERVVVYSRFFQHAINESTQKKMLVALSEQLSKDSEIFFEFRLDADADKPKLFGTDHYRRFQSAESFIATLDECGFECTYNCQGMGYARYGEEDPVVGRFVAQPKKQQTLRVVS